jgi:hypothetical protein
MTKYTSDDVLEFDEWLKGTIKKIYDIEEDWLRYNLFKAGIPANLSAKTRCKIVKQDISHIWHTTLYIDDIIVSILSVNSITLEATIFNADGFTSKGNI